MNPLLLLATAALLVACPSAGSTPVAAPTPSFDVDAIAVNVAPVARGDVVRTLELGGVAEAWRAARLAPSAQGVVDTLTVQLGDRVTEGQLLAAIDTTPLRLSLEATRRAVDLAQIQVRDAQGEADRARPLAESGAITSRDADKAALGLELATAQLEQVRAQSASLEGQMRMARVEAPFAGRVTALSVEKGEFFSGMGAMGGPPMLVEVQALDVIKLDVNVPESDLSRVREGLTVDVESDAFVEERFVGEVTLVNPAATSGSRTFLLRIKIPNEDGRLRPGMFLRAHILVESQPDVVFVPEQAVTQFGEESYVMVVANGKAERRGVTPGLRGDVGWQVAGVEAGESVVVKGHFGLPHGASVRVVN